MYISPQMRALFCMIFYFIDFIVRAFYFISSEMAIPHITRAMMASSTFHAFGFAKMGISTRAP